MNRPDVQSFVATPGSPELDLGEDYVLDFADIGPDDLGRVGGKGQNLGLLDKAGIQVPPGFCVTTAAFHRFVAGDRQYTALLAELATLEADDLPAVRDLGQRLRSHMHGRALPEDIRIPVLAAWRRMGAERSYAVRSSATAEDLPTASFAGQQDSYLNVRGQDALLARIRDCFASLYTDRAILYRIEKGIAHRDVALCAVVQVMVRAERSGILFTADPMTGHRHTMAIDAGFGLGESLVSGLVSADLYKLDKRTGQLQSCTVGDKQLAIWPAPDGGTVTQPLPDDMRSARVLDDSDLDQLLEVGRAIESAQGSPQDIEWCFEDGVLYVVQSRPITSLYPLPAPPANAVADHASRAYFSFNHFQVMTDAMPPMACSLWQLLTPFGKPEGAVAYSPWTAVAGGRLYIDAGYALRQPRLRRLVLTVFGGIDELAASQLAQLAGREDMADGPRLPFARLLTFMLPRASAALGWLLVRDVEGRAALMRRATDRLVESARARISSASTLVGKLEAAQALVGQLVHELLFLPQQIIPGIIAGKLIRKLVDDGSDDASDDIAALSRGLVGNVTTDMDLEVGDLADVARQYPDVVACLRGEEISLADLAQVPGGEVFLAELQRFLDHYGMRGPSEIDISRPRWRDDPSSILRTIAGNLAHAESGAHRAHHEALQTRAQNATDRILARCHRGPLGFLRVRLVRRLIRVHREMLALREHPKFVLVRVLDMIRDLVLTAGRSLHQDGYLAAVDDVWFLRLDELIQVVRQPDHQVARQIAERKTAHEHHRQLSPPRVMTGDGEIPVVQRERGELPADALLGSPASAGVVEGVARVIRDPTREVLQKGDVLVAPFTDPGWTPLFLNASALIMEVGGLMTHGSVVAREYGIPAVVCVPDATSRIETGMRVRVDGDQGYVQILEGTQAEEAIP